MTADPKMVEALNPGWWTPELLDVIIDRATQEFEKVPPGDDGRYLWATIGGMAETIRAAIDALGEIGERG